MRRGGSALGSRGDGELQLAIVAADGKARGRAFASHEERLQPRHVRKLERAEPGVGNGSRGSHDLQHRCRRKERCAVETVIGEIRRLRVECQRPT